MSASTAKERIGFVGIGNMGWPMARNLVKAGYPVHVLDRDPARAARFAAECGGSAAATPANVGREAEIVITMLPSGSDVRAALLGEQGGGIAATLAPGSIVVDMSSSDPVGTRELGAELAKRGIALIDAPVSGLVPKAEAGTLTIMIGADDERAVERATPALECLGERLVRIGSLGCGHAMKALNNLVAATAFAVTAEALIAGSRFGLDPAVMVEVLQSSTGRSFHSQFTFPEHVLTRRFASGFTLGLLVKDVGIAADLCKAIGVDSPIADLVRRLWTEGRDELGADQDNSAVVKRWERLSGTVLQPASRRPAE